MHAIDAHHHVWDLSVRDQDWITGPELAPLRRDFTVAELAPQARAAGVTATVLVQTVAVAEETPELLALAADEDLVAGVVGWTDLTSPGITDELARLKELPGGGTLVGIRHQVQGEPDPAWLTRTDVLRGLRAVADAGLAYDLLVLPHQLPAAARAATLVPELRFILDHVGKPPVARAAPEPWRHGLRALAARPNTACKLSGLVTEADWHAWTVEDLRPYAREALDAFTPERVMFGSDWPVCTLAAEYTEVVATTEDIVHGLSPSERNAVWADNASRLYRLS